MTNDADLQISVRERIKLKEVHVGEGLNVTRVYGIRAQRRIWP